MSMSLLDTKPTGLKGFSRWGSFSAAGSLIRGAAVFAPALGQILTQVIQTANNVPRVCLRRRGVSYPVGTIFRESTIREHRDESLQREIVPGNPDSSVCVFVCAAQGATFSHVAAACFCRRAKWCFRRGDTRLVRSEGSVVVVYWPTARASVLRSCGTVD